MKRLGVAWLFCLLLSSGLAAQPIGFELFDFVARVLQDDYINPRGLNVDNVVEKYRTELLKKCPSLTDCPYSNAQPVVKAMLKSFDDAHLVYSDYASSDSDTELGDPVTTGRYGFWVHPTSMVLAVSDVYARSPADSAGIRVGDVVVSVNDQPASPIVLGKKLRELELSFVETTIKLRRGDQLYTVRMRPTYSNILYPVLDDLGNSVFRIKMYEFGINLHDRLVHDLIRTANTRGAKALILDLRYNEGGSGLTSLKIAAAFISQPSEVSIEKDGSRYRFQYNDGVIQWQDLNDATNKGVFEGQLRNPASFAGAVIVLTTAKTFSAAEHVAALLQSAKRAVVIGEATAGALDTGADYKQFKDLGTMYYGSSRYQNLKGEWLPSRVTPDVKIADFASGQDDVLREAIKRLTTSKP